MMIGRLDVIMHSGELEIFVLFFVFIQTPI